MGAVRAWGDLGMRIERWKRLGPPIQKYAPTVIPSRSSLILHRRRLRRRREIPSPCDRRQRRLLVSRQHAGIVERECLASRGKDRRDGGG